jgi:Tat protein translocase TatB subunit
VSTLQRSVKIDLETAVQTMFGTLGGPELFLIFVVALIVFGPRKLPEIGKSLGKMMAEFRKASNEFRSTIESEVEAEKIRDSMRIDLPKLEPGPVQSPSQPAVTPEAAPVAPVSPAEPPGAGDPAAGGYPDTPATPSPTVERAPETVSRQPEPTPIEPK